MIEVDGVTQFGWPLPKRLEEFAARSADSALPTHRVVFERQNRDFPIIRVPIELPKYRMENGRTVSAQQEYLAKNPSARPDLFVADPELIEVQRIQHSILVGLANKADLLKTFSDASYKQVEPLLLTHNGFVLNGNRRLAAWRDLLWKDTATFGHFAYIDVVVLPPCGDRELDRIEAALQIQKDIKADYSWDSKANMMLEKRRRDSLSDRELADMYGLKESEVRELLDMRDYADEYLRCRGKENRWSEVADDEFAFRKIVASRSKLSSVGEQELFKHCAFAVVDSAGEAGARLYQVIPEIEQSLPEIRNALQERFPVQVDADDSANLDLFGGSGFTEDIDIPLSIEIQKEANIGEAREVILNAVESQRQLNKDAKAANFLVKTLAQVNASLDGAVRSGLHDGTVRAGVAEQLVQIRAKLGQIEEWLQSSAND